MGHSLFSSILCPPLNPLSPYILYSYFVYNRVRAHVADRETPTPAACLCLRHKKHAICSDEYGPGTNNTRNSALSGKHCRKADTCPSGLRIFPLPRAYSAFSVH